jgi:hypothetical protein
MRAGWKAVKSRVFFKTTTGCSCSRKFCQFRISHLLTSFPPVLSAIALSSYIKYPFWITILFLSYHTPTTIPNLSAPFSLLLVLQHLFKWVRIAQSVYKLATGYTVRGSNPGGDEIFRTCPDRPRGPPSPVYNGCWVIHGGKAVGLQP